MRTVLRVQAPRQFLMGPIVANHSLAFFSLFPVAAATTRPMFSTRRYKGQGHLKVLDRTRISKCHCGKTATINGIPRGGKL